MSFRKELKDRMPRKCAQCGNTIVPGKDIWTIGETVYCGAHCAIKAAGIVALSPFTLPAGSLRVVPNDNYLDYFPKKSEDLFAREEERK